MSKISLFKNLENKYIVKNNLIVNMNNTNNTNNTKTKNKDVVFLPAETEVCATCSYWDGERKVDEDLKLVIINADQQGTCLVKDQSKLALFPKHLEYNCLWEDLHTTNEENHSCCSNKKSDK